MKRLSMLLLVLIGVELAALAFRVAAPPLPEFPVADLTLIADRVTIDTLTKMPQELDHRNPAHWKQLGEYYLAFGYYPQAEFCFLTTSRLSPHDDSLLLLRAVSLDRLGNKREAIDLYRQAIEKNVRDAGNFRIRIAHCLLAEGNVSAAMNELEAMGEDPVARLIRSRLLIRSGHAREAQTLLEGLQRDLPNNVEPFSMYGWAAEELGDNQTAISYQNRSLRARENMAHNPLIRQEDIYLRRQHSYYAFQLRSIELEAAGRDDEARAACREAVRAMWDEDVVRSYAVLEINLGQPQTAIELLKDAIQRVGASAATLDALGEAWNRAGNTAQAREVWLRACEMQATASIHEKLARSFIEIGDMSCGEWHRGLAEYERGKQAWLDNRVLDAQKLFRSATQRAPAHASSWYYLGETQRLTGEEQAAIDSFKQCLKIDPSHGRSWHAMQRMLTLPNGK